MQVQGSLEELVHIIQQLGEGHFRYTLDQVKEMLDIITNDCPFSIYPMPQNTDIFRGRYVSSGLVGNVSELLNRADKDVKDFGRCHKPGLSVLYGSNNLDAVLSELRAEVGQIIQVIQLAPKKDYSLRITAIGEVDHARRYGRALLGNDQTVTMINDFIESLAKEQVAKLYLRDAFMADLFSRQAYHQIDYKLTSALSDIVFSMHVNGEPIKGFAYPSVAHRGGLNYAIHGSYVDKSLDVAGCFAYEIVDYLGFGIYGRKKIATSSIIHDDGTIEWERS